MVFPSLAPAIALLHKPSDTVERRPALAPTIDAGGELIGGGFGPWAPLAGKWVLSYVNVRTLARSDGERRTGEVDLFTTDEITGDTPPLQPGDQIRDAKGTVYVIVETTDFEHRTDVWYAKGRLPETQT